MFVFYNNGSRLYFCRRWDGDKPGRFILGSKDASNEYDAPQPLYAHCKEVAEVVGST